MEEFQRTEEEHSEDEPPDVIGDIKFQVFQPDCVECFFNVQEGNVSFLLLTCR